MNQHSEWLRGAAVSAVSKDFDYEGVRVTDGIDAAADEIDRLEQLIADAPHERLCERSAETYAITPPELRHKMPPCDCWKSRAITPCDHKDWEPVWPQTMSESGGTWRCRTCGIKGTYTVEPA